MSDELDTLLDLMQPKVQDGILYKSFCAEFDVRDITANELWELFDVRWAALSEVRLDKGLETFLMRDSADSTPSTVQVAALDPAGHVIGGLRIHISPLTLLGGFQSVQISRVGVAWIARGAGIGHVLVGRALRIGRALGAVKSLPLVFLLSRILDTTDPNRVLRFYERIGFRRTNLYTVTKGLSNCLMLAGVKMSSLQYLRSQGFQVEEARERGALYPTLLIASSVARQIQTAGLGEEKRDLEEKEADAFSLQSSHVSVRRFLSVDLPTLHHWEHLDVLPGYATFSRIRPSTMAELEDAFAAEVKQDGRQRLAIETNQGQLIGFLLYYDLNYDTRSIFIDVMIGEPDYWQDRYGLEALGLLLEYLFEKMGLHRVSIVVSREQRRLIADLETLRFQRDGVLRHNEVVEGHYIDHYVLSILEDEYQA